MMGEMELGPGTVTGRAPARVSLVGGGTDLPAYYEKHGGAVVSFAIARYAYGHLSPRKSDLELVSLDQKSREIIHAAHLARRLRRPIIAEEFLTYQKAVAVLFGIERARIAAGGDVPIGAGLASSGAICVALVTAATAFLGEEATRYDIAEAAFDVEMRILRRPCGKQDQYASAFGGCNLIEFDRDGSVQVTPLALRPETIRGLEERAMIFSNGSRRSATGPLTEQERRSGSDPDTVHALGRLKDMAYEMRDVLERGDLDRVGTLLDEAWAQKQHLNSQVGTPEIAQAYGAARAAGATGGKLAGAGMGGTLVMWADPYDQDEVRGALSELGWSQRPMTIDWDGAVLTEAATVSP